MNHRPQQEWNRNLTAHWNKTDDGRIFTQFLNKKKTFISIIINPFYLSCNK